MKKSFTGLRFLATVLLLVMNAMMLTSCDKESDEPEEVIETFQKLHCQLMLNVDGETFTGDFAIIEDHSDILVLTLRCDNYNSLDIYFHPLEGDSTTLKLSYQHLMADSNTGFGIYHKAFGPYDQKSYNLQHGEVTIIKLDSSQYRVYGHVYGYEAPDITFSLEGGVYDEDYPIGEGMLAVGDRELPLDRASYNVGSFYSYTFYSITYGHNISIMSKEELTHDMPIGEDYRSGEFVTVTISVKNPEPNSYTFISPECGTLHVSRDNDRYIISMDFPSEHGQVRVAYNGYTFH